MKKIDTGFDGLILIEPTVYQDNRGFFYESWREADYLALGIQEKFLQDDFSFSKKNVLRGMHFSKKQGQLVTVVYGKIFDVVVDMRQTSPTFKKHFAMELNGAKPQQLYMSPGFAHGFCVLSEYAVINYKCTNYYDPIGDQGIAWNDPTIGINWPDLDFIISEKDQSYI